MYALKTWEMSSCGRRLYGYGSCILVGENKGYSSANNIGLSAVKTKYALVLNHDTVLDKNAIQNFFALSNTKNDFWLMGPANDQMIELDFGEKNLIEVDNLKGFAIFFNMSKFQNIFFDESQVPGNSTPFQAHFRALRTGINRNKPFGTISGNFAWGFTLSNSGARKPLLTYN